MQDAPIHVLVVGDDAAVVGEATVALAATGHTVSHVTPESGTPFVWAAAETRGFEAREIDVVLSIPGHAMAAIPWCEDRVIDLVGGGIPLVLAGTPLASPYTVWASRCVRPGDNVVEACETVAHQSMPPLAAPADEQGRPGDLSGYHASGAEVLTKGHCLDLAASTVGRIGLTSGALPVILPMEYRLWNDRVVFRTEAGTRLDAAASGAVVAFEVDALSPTDSWGWTVMVTGLAQDLSDTRAASETTFPTSGWWRAGGPGRLFGVSTEIVSGCRVRTPPSTAVDAQEPAQG